ncbi:hypothetical protein DTO164E3_3822 [Paecilomyces variotii]|nr:hypothetical protein DTO164E3_3822 [Paecilomyces variotii]KAJ9206068.1 hypothetical protein DTO032I3_1933 [Paecilomyces variotii]KAJ9281729.1 hypothetical protein DTO021D3_1495 [Paecilomyces variotii]KAJ9345991.1 hypothetical protein DTO027B6_1405 [Paecilomyces variotii]KAJ9392370.1 hypothetical protein DTO032I4_784 [Paecilomyces variotii]
MSEPRDQPGPPHRARNLRNNNHNQKREKKPPLTHFLCFPLVNDVSLPQLESSIATFKAAIPSRLRTENDHPLKPTPPLIPDGAVRPVGTLHLTLGVMSLPTKERLDEAINLLQSLDLVSIAREAEARAKSMQNRARALLETPLNPDFVDSEPPATAEAQEGLLPTASGQLATGTDSVRPVTPDSPEPLIVSLESMHALPRARSATVLYAAPVDPTSRLYPFSVLLREKFLEAGFLEGEYKKPAASEDQGSQKAEGNSEGLQKVESNSRPEAEATLQQSLLEEVPTGLAEDPTSGPSSSKIKLKEKKPKARPLLLHATVVNTIYAGRGRRRDGGPKNGTYTFDARDILAHYRDYYIDADRTQPRSTIIATGISEDQLSAESNSDAEGGKDEGNRPPEKKQKQMQNKRPGADDSTKIPFLWARDIPIDKVCICEMGAKKLDASNGDPNAERLSQAYKVIAERSLGFHGPRNAIHTSADEDTNSVDGGVAVNASG